MLARLDLASSKYYAWLKRRDSENCHNAKTPKNGWLLPDEKRAIIGFYDQNLSEGYRRLAYMMNDQGVVAASPSSVRRVLLEAERIRTRDVHKSKKGNGFEQPIRPIRSGTETSHLSKSVESSTRIAAFWMAFHESSCIRNFAKQ